MYLMPIMNLSTTEIGQVLKTKVMICLLLEYQNFYYKKNNKNLSLINIILIIIHISLFFFLFDEHISLLKQLGLLLSLSGQPPRASFGTNQSLDPLVIAISDHPNSPSSTKSTNLLKLSNVTGIIFIFSFLNGKQLRGRKKKKLRTY